MNQQDSKKKFNPDNIPQKGDDKKKPRFNIYWVYGIIFLTIIDIFDLHENIYIFFI